MAIAVLLAALLPSAPAAAAQRLCNGGFESAGCWTAGGEDPERAAMTTQYPRSGTRSAELCSMTNCHATFTQTFIAPTSVVRKATFRYWYATFSQEPTCANTLLVALLSSDEMEAVPGEPLVSCPGNTDGVWAERTHDATAFLRAHAGEVVSVKMLAENRGTFPTDWYVDDVVVDVELGHRRDVSLRLRNHLVAKGAVTGDGYGRCVKGVTVKVQRKVDGTWTTLKRATTDTDGRYRVGLRDRTGKYRAVAPAFDATPDHRCFADTTVTKTHSH